MHPSASRPAVSEYLAGATVGPRQSPRVIWMDVPEELRHIVEPYLARALPLLPRWVVELRVIYELDDSASMMTRVRPDYRTVTLSVCPLWFTQQEQKRRSDVVHEFVHAPLESLRILCTDLIAKVPDESFRDYLRDDLRRRLESAVVDVEEMLTVALGGTNA